MDWEECPPNRPEGFQTVEILRVSPPPPPPRRHSGAAAVSMGVCVGGGADDLQVTAPITSQILPGYGVCMCPFLRNLLEQFGKDQRQSSVLPAMPPSPSPHGLFFTWKPPHQTPKPPSAGTTQMWRMICPQNLTQSQRNRPSRPGAQEPGGTWPGPGAPGSTAPQGERLRRGDGEQEQKEGPGRKRFPPAAQVSCPGGGALSFLRTLSSLLRHRTRCSCPG